jgi:transcriptional regulator with GAF, ATPase, and Fis domain
MSRLSLLVDFSAVLGRQIDLDTLLAAAATRIAEALHAERATIWIADPDEGGLVSQVAVLPEVARLVQPLGVGLSGRVAQTGERLLIPDVTRDARFDKRTDQQTGWTTRSMLVVPIREQPDQPIRGVLQVLNKVSGTFVQEDLDYVTALGRQLALVFSLTSLHAERRTQPGLTLRGRFNKVIGRSPAMDAVYQRIMLAAETDATVLLQGETGTGKGVFARAIHDNSKRQAGPLVVLDATTLPAQLVESELFGHERGAFTGADRRVLGKVELAQGGTLLIDEIGDLPLESQGKLLRLLQDREFERVGGRESIASSARVVCATHRDLERMVAEGRFRQDLLYRVKVVQIAIPPLRERGAAEIALLAAHFGRMYAERYGRPQPEWTPRVLDSLAAHAWPGNVRELEHWVESAVVLCPGGQVQPFEPHASTPPMPREGSSTPAGIPVGLTLDEAIRAYAQRTLDEAGGNKTEAARQLGIGRNRLARVLGSA